MTCPFSHTGSFQVTVLEAKTFPGEMTRQHRQMIQAVMRSVPPCQVMLVPCPPGPHFKVFPQEWGRSPPNPEASAWTPPCRGRHHQSLALSCCAHSHCIRHRLSRQGTPALGFSTLSLRLSFDLGRSLPASFAIFFLSFIPTCLEQQTTSG